MSRKSTSKPRRGKPGKRPSNPSTFCNHLYLVSQRVDGKAKIYPVMATGVDSAIIWVRKLTEADHPDADVEPGVVSLIEDGVIELDAERIEGWS